MAKRTPRPYPAARKRFGQNFLHDVGVINDIIGVIAPRAGQRLVEIGPGRGALTAPLLAQSDSLDVIELDRDLVPRLKIQFATQAHLRIHQADALSFDYYALQQADEKLRVIGNLPYNITTPLLFHLLTQSEIIEDMCFMLQKEVVARICAVPGSKAYGKLSVMLQFQCETEYVFTVPPEAFEPAPKVESAIVYLKPKTVRDDRVTIKALSEVVSKAFSMRRKTIANTLKGLLTAAQIEAVGLDPTQRPETISLSEYIDLTMLSGEKQ